MSHDILGSPDRRVNRREGTVISKTTNGGSVMRAAGSLIFTAGLALACTDTTGPALTYTMGGTVWAWRGRGWCSATTTAAICS